MGQPSTPASNAIIYITYGAFLLVSHVALSSDRELAGRVTDSSQGFWLLCSMETERADEGRHPGLLIYLAVLHNQTGALIESLRSRSS